MTDPAGIHPNCQTDTGTTGSWYQFLLRDDSGRILDGDARCLDDNQPEPRPASPPAPPTVEELVDAAPIPEPVIRANPSARGLTGLESRFWVEEPDAVSALASIRGWTVAGRLTIERWIWDTGDGGHHVVTHSGTEDDPAVPHTYETKGTWPVTVAVSWSGSYEVSGYGLSYTVDGLSAEGSSSIDYPVIEVRAVLDDQEASR